MFKVDNNCAQNLIKLPIHSSGYYIWELDIFGNLSLGFSRLLCRYFSQGLSLETPLKVDVPENFKFLLKYTFRHFIVQ